MKKNENRRNHLADLIIESMLDDQKKAEKVLSAAGMDVSKSTAHNLAFFQRLRAEAKLNRASHDIAELDSETSSAASQVAFALRRMGMSAIEYLALLQKQKKLSMSFRNIESLGEEDAIEIIVEAGLQSELNAGGRDIE